MEDKKNNTTKYQEIECLLCGQKGVIVVGNDMASEAYGLKPIFRIVTDQKLIDELNESLFDEFLDHGDACILGENMTIDDINQKIINEEYEDHFCYIKKTINNKNVYYKDSDEVVTYYSCPHCGAEMIAHLPLDKMYI